MYSEISDSFEGQNRESLIEKVRTTLYCSSHDSQEPLSYYIVLKQLFQFGSNEKTEQTHIIKKKWFFETTKMKKHNLMHYFPSTFN